MVRHADHGSLTLGVAGTSSRLAQGMGRSQRTLRQLTANSGHTIHVHYPGNRQPNPPLILQRWNNVIFDGCVKWHKMLQHLLHHHTINEDAN